MFVDWPFRASCWRIQLHRRDPDVLRNTNDGSLRYRLQYSLHVERAELDLVSCEKHENRGGSSCGRTCYACCLAESRILQSSPKRYPRSPPWTEESARQKSRLDMVPEIADLQAEHRCSPYRRWGLKHQTIDCHRMKSEKMVDDNRAGLGLDSLRDIARHLGRSSPSQLPEPCLISL